MPIPPDSICTLDHFLSDFAAFAWPIFLLHVEEGGSFRTLFRIGTFMPNLALVERSISGSLSIRIGMPFGSVPGRVDFRFCSLRRRLSFPLSLCRGSVFDLLTGRFLSFFAGIVLGLLVAVFHLLGLTWAHGPDCRVLQILCGGLFSAPSARWRSYDSRSLAAVFLLLGLTWALGPDYHDRRSKCGHTSRNVLPFFALVHSHNLTSFDVPSLIVLLRLELLHLRISLSTSYSPFGLTW